MKGILDVLAPVASRSAASRFAVKSVTDRRLRTYAKSSRRPRSWLQSLLPCCRRVQRTLQFVVKGARGNYPVQLQQVRSMSRNRKYVFHNAAGIPFTMKGFRVPLIHCHVCKSQTYQVAPGMWGRPSRGQLIEFSAEESKASCRADGVFDVQTRYSGGSVGSSAAMRGCLWMYVPDVSRVAHECICVPFGVAGSGCLQGEVCFYSRSLDAHASFVSSHIALPLV